MSLNRSARHPNMIMKKSRRRSRRSILAPLDPPKTFKFTHSPLNFSHSTIRLLKIIPDGDATSVRCTLHHFPINAVAYTCLSYTWGATSPQRTIYINGSPFCVRQNLHDFLQQARAIGKSDFLWIDAICINQNSVRERNHQVSLMSSIYSQADCVVVWLGKGDSSIQQLLQIIKGSGSDWDMGSSSKNSAQRGYAHDKDGIRRCTESMDKLNAIPFWSRLWIMQEIALSHKKIVLYGPISVNWTDFARFWVDVGEASKNRYPRAELQNILDIGNEATTKHSISYLVSMTTSMQCQDGRDRIYGILGIARGCEAFRVDYSAGPADLFCRALELFIPDQTISDPFPEFRSYFEDLLFALKPPLRLLQRQIASRYHLFLDDVPILTDADDNWMNAPREYRSANEILSPQDFRELGRLVISGCIRQQVF